MYNEILRELSREYEKKRDQRQREEELRKQKVYRKIPAIRRIDEEIFQTGLDMTKSIIGNPNYKEDLKKFRERLKKLEMEKAYLLTESNIPSDYMDVPYDCKECKDSGYLEDGRRCHCLEQALVSRAYEMSNIEDLLKKQNFNSFDLKVFSNEKFPGENLTPRENMMELAGIAQNFVNNFDIKDGMNLLFYGNTGLGKTFLSNCIAKELLDKRKLVIYQTAFTILEIIEKHRFQRGDKKTNQYKYNLLFEADLLIIDDLGTELSNSFTSAEIFNIVNTRILAGKKTIISTNLTPKEISKIYTDRVFSRVFDKFIPLKFYGQDLRWQ